MAIHVNQLRINDQALLLIPQNVEETLFEGYLMAKDEEFRMQIILQSPLTLKDARFNCEWKLKNLLSGYEDILQKRLQQSSTLAIFLEELKLLVENLLSFKTDNGTSNCNRYNIIMKDLNLIGWNKLMYINEEFAIIKLTVSAEKNRKHVITVNVNYQSGIAKLTCMTDLPVPFQPRFTQQDGALKLVYEQFVQTVGTYQQFWNMVDEIDRCCWVLEPENKTYGCTYRRIALGKNSSVHIKINPVQPLEFPECRLLGADHIIEPLKKKMNDNMGCWSSKHSVLENLKEILHVEFPSPTTVSKEEVSMECGICYAYRLLDEIPERTCDDSRCGQTYHNSCLVEWLRSLPTCRQSFNVIFGECPYCNKSMSVRLGKPGN